MSPKCTCYPSPTPIFANPHNLKAQYRSYEMVIIFSVVLDGLSAARPQRTQPYETYYLTLSLNSAEYREVRGEHLQ
jgi:hypothetical protein